MTGYGSLNPTWGDVIPEVRKKEQLNQLERELEGISRTKKYFPSRRYDLTSVYNITPSSWINDQASISINVPEGGFIGLYCEAEVDTTVAGGFLGFRDVQEFATPKQIAQFPQFQSYTTYIATGGRSSAYSKWPIGGLIIYPASTGTHEIYMAYRVLSGSMNVRNRTLIGVIL